MMGYISVLFTYLLTYLLLDYIEDKPSARRKVATGGAEGLTIHMQLLPGTSDVVMPQLKHSL